MSGEKMVRMVVIHGSHWDGRGKKNVGEVVEIPESDVKHIDPNGTKFATPEEWAAIKKQRAAEAELKKLKAKRAEQAAAKGKAVDEDDDEDLTDEELEEATDPKKGNQGSTPKPGAQTGGK